MAYFNHAFCKSFVVADFPTAGDATSTFTPGDFDLVQDWQAVGSSGSGVVPTVDKIVYLVQGSFHTQDNIGNNPGHGGYKESVKSKGINPRFITRLWSAECVTATAATVTIDVGSTCAPCGANLFLRLDVKGAPALRFLNHNAYAIGDSSGSAAINDVPGNCCVDGQTYLDPAVALAKAAAMLLEDPIISPFVQEAAGGGIVVTTAGVPATYTIEQALGLATSGNYTPSTDPVGDQVTATVTFEGAYVDTKFGTCSFDTRDYYGKEPVQLIGSVLDETGDPCNDCGVVTTTPGTMQQTSGETVLREILMTENYMQSPYNQGNPDSARIREIEGSDDILAAIDRNALYKGYYIQHTVPRYNNPTGVFDNDQYLYKVYVKCTDTAGIAGMENIMANLRTFGVNGGNPGLVYEANID